MKILCSIGPSKAGRAYPSATHCWHFLFDLMLYNLVNNFTVMSGQLTCLPGLNQY